MTCICNCIGRGVFLYQNRGVGGSDIEYESKDGTINLHAFDLALVSVQFPHLSRDCDFNFYRRGEAGSGEG